MRFSRNRRGGAAAEPIGLAARFALLLASFVGVACGATAGAALTELQVEYSDRPLGIDVETPRFSWQMQAPEGARGYSQNAYRIVVAGPNDQVMWDTGKVGGDTSLAIPYEGTPLRATTRYTWSVTAWDQKGEAASASSWFEIGLMNPDPDLSAWDGATWIGGDDDLVLYSHYLSIFDVAYTLAIQEGSSKASFVFGANDLRLMDANKNVYQVESARDESYLELELGVSALDGSPDGQARLNVYRVGYTDTDSRAAPLQSFAIERVVIDDDNKHADHRFELESVFGEISITLDGSTSFAGETDPPEGAGGRRFGRGGGGSSVNLNPMGRGGNYITFGMLCDMGFSVGAGQRASFSDVVVSNNRVPKNTLFSEDLTSPGYDGIHAAFAADARSGLTVEGGRYVLDGGADGAFLAADPSRNSTPMLRTEFQAADETIQDARLYVTARGIYEVYLNGARVGADYFNPGLTQYDRTHMYQTYDVSEMVRSGPNVLGAMLSEGWWSGLLSFGSIWNHFGDRQSLLVKLVVRYSDGSTDVVTSNPGDWKYFGGGPLLSSPLLQSRSG